MRTTLFMMVAAGSLASAQVFGAEPSCAIACLTSAFSVAGCAQNDQACQCGTGQAAIASAVAPCLFSACTSNSDLNSAISVGQGLCSAYSSSLASVSATTTSPGSSASSTGGVTSTSGVSTSTITASTTSVPVTTILSGTSSSTSSKESTSASVTVVSSSTGSSSSSTAGAAPTMAVGIGAVVGVLAGVVAAL